MAIDWRDWRNREQLAIWVMALLVLILLGLALYGYLSGAWEQDPLNATGG